ncbi:hypothetical protein SAMN04487960_10862 [Marinobacter mobilis]|uniref:DUF8198 domain-containing protein n=2 Tax=Marinobacter mobilis TaxID=488533 RepID=A0A1H3AS33_9GAMM|nr:hypothetical protein [Marinobacter mobilis]SDX31944.1 hypothetical protein SAMN04487960_10862 [Marinobacter mobilis]
MYRNRLIQTPVHSDGARRLQQQLLAYHDFRQHKASHSLAPMLTALGHWQAERLKKTHQDLYRQPNYHQGLNFLLTDLYSPTDLSQRDDSIDRVFPKMVKWVPEHLLATFAGLVELNLTTQTLDLGLAETLVSLNHPISELQEWQYCEAYRTSGQLVLRRRQIELVAEVGSQLDRYVRNRTLGWLLSMTRSAADLAGLADLHDFLHRGYSAFRAMDNVEQLIDELVVRETRVLEQIVAASSAPFDLATGGQADLVS